MTDNLGKLKQFIFKENCQISRDFGKIHTGIVVSMCVSSDGKYLFTCSADGLVKKICLETPNRVLVKNIWGNSSRVIPKILCIDCTTEDVTKNNVMVMSSDDTYLWVGTGKGAIVRIKTENFESREFKGNFGHVTSILVHNDYDLYIGNKEGDFHFIQGDLLYEKNPKTSVKKRLSEVWDSITKKRHTFNGDTVRIDEMITWKGIFNSEVNGLKLSSDKDKIFVCSNYDNNVKIFSAKNREFGRQFYLGKEETRLDCSVIELLTVHGEDYLIAGDGMNLKVFGLDGMYGEKQIYSKDIVSLCSVG